MICVYGYIQFVDLWFIKIKLLRDLMEQYNVCLQIYSTYEPMVYEISKRQHGTM